MRALLRRGLLQQRAGPLNDRRYDLAVELEPLAARLGMPAFHWHATYALAAAATVDGDPGRLRSLLAAGTDLAQRYRMAEAEAIHSFGDAMLAHIGGRLDEAERIYRESAERLRLAGSVTPRVSSRSP